MKLMVMKMMMMTMIQSYACADAITNTCWEENDWFTVVSECNQLQNQIPQSTSLTNQNWQFKHGSDENVNITGNISGEQKNIITTKEGLYHTVSI